MTNAELGWLMRQGMAYKRMMESKQFFITRIEKNYHVNPVGAAVVGKFKDRDKAVAYFAELPEAGDSHYAKIAMELGVEAELLQIMQKVHALGLMKVREIASELISGQFPANVPEEYLP